ncbi:integral membrane protein [Colletotrichum asianum]|uniref:Integral membrane protein n=1 Tax=Colletotrichum asianum TaxID=702518 RepID=A0A8H3W6B7_9PEZI|nr:integral membrane protein [Colletotrichum asianum]
MCLSSAESKGTSIIATICIIVGISTLFVLGRLFVRTKILGKAHLDDHLTVLSLLLSYVTVGLEIWAVQSGNGRHVACSAALDLYLAIYPATVLMRLQMNIKKKVIPSVALGIASISCFISIYKSTRLPSLASKDFTYDSADLVVWTVVEGNTLIIASCIPVLGPLVELALGRRVLSSTDRKYQKQSDTGGLRSGGIEMDDSRPMNRNGNVVGKNLTVIQSRHDRDDASSQESILVGTAGSAHRPRGIMRTDDVTVSFDSRSVADGRKKEGDGPKWDAFQSRD